ncbi:MAG: hypothetical protein FJZ04_00455 [Candidatus Moranbacteria bacterium]|nr:hypothetical protein [Candidatus Moranbacteria bacterium]
MLNFFVSAAESAESSGSNSLMTCNGMDCDVCKLLEMISNIATWVMGTSFVFAILFMVIGGFVYIGSRGNENWMFQAKRTVIWSIIGFGFILFGWIAIQTTFRISGATDQAIWSSFECVSDSEDISINIPRREAGYLINSAASGGEVSGKLTKGTPLSDLVKLFSRLDKDDILILEVRAGKNTETFAVIGKRNEEPELLYINRSAIIDSLKSSFKPENLLGVSSAYAAGNNSAEIEKFFSELAQLVNRLLENNIEIITIITDRPNINLKDNPAGNIPVSAILDIVQDINQCFTSGGVWFRFNDICGAEQEKCESVKCTSEKSRALITACNCPEGKCLQGSQCVQKK